MENENQNTEQLNQLFTPEQLFDPRPRSPIFGLKLGRTAIRVLLTVGVFFLTYKVIDICYKLESKKYEIIQSCVTADVVKTPSQMLIDIKEETK